MNIITFHVVDQNNHLYNCKIFNRPFYMGMLEYGVDLTIVATYQEQRKELNVINIKKGEIPSEERLKPLYHLPSGILHFPGQALLRRGPKGSISLARRLARILWIGCCCRATAISGSRRSLSCRTSLLFFIRSNAKAKLIRSIRALASLGASIRACGFGSLPCAVICWVLGGG